MSRRLTKHLVWTTAATAAEGYALTRFALAPTAEKESLHLDLALPPREQAIYLLHVGAEVEHALMTQYLYAAYSLGGDALSTEQRKIAKQWRDVIAQIAREEMGHLATVENILTLIGAPLTFDREDYPIPRDLYPFPFELEPLTKKSLGKYVLAEMPSEAVIKKLGLEKTIEEIQKYVGGEAISESLRVHRVGTIYDAISGLFEAPSNPQQPPASPPAFIHSEDISADSLRFQVRPEEWGLGYKEELICTAVDRRSAKEALRLISTQGEGSTIDDLQSSHFGRFLDIYRSFPDEKSWQPARCVARNPSTGEDSPMDRRITHPLALQWAGLCNLRYRMLLMLLAHSFHIETPVNVAERTPRGLLISWAFGEMYNLRSVAEILMDLPLHPGGNVLAGPPFEMPYSLALSSREPGRWRQHRDLLLASQKYIRDLQGRKTGHENYLRGLEKADQDALNQIATMLGGLS